MAPTVASRRRESTHTTQTRTTRPGASVSGPLKALRSGILGVCLNPTLPLSYPIVPTAKPPVSRVGELLAEGTSRFAETLLASAEALTCRGMNDAGREARLCPMQIQTFIGPMGVSILCIQNEQPPEVNFFEELARAAWGLLWRRAGHRNPWDMMGAIWQGAIRFGPGENRGTFLRTLVEDMRPIQSSNPKL